MTDSNTSSVSPRRFSDGVSLPELARYLREGVYIMDADGVVLDANPVALDLLGVRSLTDGPPEPVHDRLRSREVWRAELNALTRDGAVREFTREFERADGSARTVLDTCYARVDGGVVTYHGVVVDVSVVAARDPRERTDAHTRDAATGAYTADYLEILDAQLGERSSPLGICVVHIHHDDRESQADGLSSTTSELERMTRFLLRHIRAYEVVVRSAHDQLVVVLPGADDRAAEIVGRRLQLTALRSAPAPFRLGWAARQTGETVHDMVGRALAHAVPVPVVERNFEPARGR
jgi:GGDEF domain-containing protein